MSMTLASICDVQWFFKFTNFCWRFIAYYSMLLALITHLTWKDQTFIWGPKVGCVFQSLKVFFIIALLLIHVNPLGITFVSILFCYHILSWALTFGKLNPLSHHLYFAPKEGYETYDQQRDVILKPKHFQFQALWVVFDEKPFLSNSWRFGKKSFHH